VPASVEQLEAHNPSPDYGRPAWVRTFAWSGAWLGGAIGSAGSVALLPLTYPLTQLCDAALGESSERELLWFPATGLASVGHAAFGAPADACDYVFRRAWVDDEQDPLTGPGTEPLLSPQMPAAPAAPQRVELDG